MVCGHDGRGDGAGSMTLPCSSVVAVAPVPGDSSLQCSPYADDQDQKSQRARQSLARFEGHRDRAQLRLVLAALGVGDVLMVTTGPVHLGPVAYVGEAHREGGRIPFAGR